MDIEEGSGELVEDEDGAVEVDERALDELALVDISSMILDVLTNPRQNTASAETACANSPRPKISKCVTVIAKSQMKYPVANACSSPLAPVYPQMRPAQFMPLRSSSNQMMYSASIQMMTDWNSDTTWTFQLIVVRLSSRG